MENLQTTRECQRCGTSFVPRASGRPQIYCTKTCYVRASSAALRAKHAPVRAIACVECGGTITHARSGRPRRFCSQQCKTRAGNRTQRRRRLPIRDPDPGARSCARGEPYCTKPFRPKRKDQIYCSSRCSANESQLRRWRGEPLRRGGSFSRTCTECGDTFAAQKANAKYCSPICRRRFTAREESRRRGPARPDHVPYVDREIFERDGWRCHICGKKIRKDLSRRHPDGATIDHLVPLSDGGSDSPANVASAHNRCNKDKGIRAMNEQLRLI